MKLTTTVLMSTLIGAALVIAPWVFMFHGPLSSNPTNWAEFGAYIGGVLSPLIAAFALIAFLRTMHQQQSQIDQLRQQGAKEDLWRVIVKIEEDFETALKRYPIRIAFGDRVHEYSGFDVAFNITFTNYAEVMTNQPVLLKSMEGKEKIARDDPHLHAYEMFAMAAGHLNQLRLYVNAYTEIAQNNAMSKYFQRKYKTPYQRFIERGYLSEAWDEAK